MSFVRSQAAPLRVLLGLLLAFSPALFAQSDNSSISGIVRDATGSAIPGAQVTVRNENTSLERRADTNDRGFYNVTNISSGSYTVIVEAKGFKRAEIKNNRLDPSIPASVNADLQVGETTETIEVTASVAGVQTETATVGKLIESRQISNLQLNGRNPIFLALLKPGVSSGTNLAGFERGLTSGGFNINGSRSQDNLITFDGAVAVRTRSNGTSIGVADLDATQEIQVLTANYNAEYGRSAGGQIRIITKSGGQQFHGSAYEYFRNNALDANQFQRNRNADPRINSEPAAFRYNQFGFNVSGPIILPKFNRDRNKLFFLWSQEWIRFPRSAIQRACSPLTERSRLERGWSTGSHQFVGQRVCRPQHCRSHDRTGLRRQPNPPQPVQP